MMFHSPAGLPAGWCPFLWWRSTRPAGRSSAGPEPGRGAQPGPKCSAAAQWRTWSTRRNIAPRIKHTHTHTWDAFNCKIKVFLERLHKMKLSYNITSETKTCIRSFTTFYIKAFFCKNCFGDAVRHDLTWSVAKTSTFNERNYGGRRCFTGLRCSRCRVSQLRRSSGLIPESMTHLHGH